MPDVAALSEGRVWGFQVLSDLSADNVILNDTAARQRSRLGSESEKSQHEKCQVDTGEFVLQSQLAQHCVCVSLLNQSETSAGLVLASVSPPASHVSYVVKRETHSAGIDMSVLLFSWFLVFARPNLLLVCTTDWREGEAIESALFTWDHDAQMDALTTRTCFLRNGSVICFGIENSQVRAVRGGSKRRP